MCTFGIFSFRCGRRRGRWVVLIGVGLDFGPQLGRDLGEGLTAQGGLVDLVQQIALLGSVAGAVLLFALLILLKFFLFGGVIALVGLVALGDESLVEVGGFAHASQVGRGDLQGVEDEASLLVFQEARSEEHT